MRQTAFLTSAFALYQQLNRIIDRFSSQYYSMFGLKINCYLLLDISNMLIEEYKLF